MRLQSTITNLQYLCVCVCTDMCVCVWLFVMDHSVE